MKYITYTFILTCLIFSGYRLINYYTRLDVQAEKTNPFENLDRVILLFDVAYDGCEGVNIPHVIRYEQIVKEYAHSAASTFPWQDYTFQPWIVGQGIITELIVTSRSYPLEVTDLRVNVRLRYNCAAERPHLRIYWETQRHPSLNAYSRDIYGRYPPHVDVHDHLYFDKTKKELSRNLELNVFAPSSGNRDIRS